MSGREPPFEQERVIIESSILAIAALFAIAQLGQTAEGISKMIPTLSLTSFFFIAAAFFAACRKMMAPWRASIDEGLNFSEVVFFSGGLVLMAAIFYSLSEKNGKNPIPVMLAIFGAGYVMLLIARWVWRQHRRRNRIGKDQRSMPPNAAEAGP